MENRTVDMKEEWIKWNPIDIPNGKYIVTKLIQDIEGTKIILDDEKNIITIFFDGITPIVRSSVEGIRMRTWGEIQKKYDNQNYFQDWFLYIVNNSKLSKWAIEESCGFYMEEKLKHYCIVTSEEIIDVIATFEPAIDISEIKL